MNPLISVIMPIYNSSSYLRRSLNSLMNQTYKEFELILIDDGSADDSLDICNAYAQKDKRIKVYHNENQGVAFVRNQGVSLASGEWIAFVDSDDWIKDNMFDLMITEAKETDADIISCGHIDVYGSKEIQGACPKSKQVLDSDAFIKELLRGQQCSGFLWDKIYKKKLFEEISFPNGKIFEDTITICQLADKAQRIALLDQCLYYYFHRKGSLCNSDFNDQYLAKKEEDLAIIEFVKTKDSETKDIAYSKYITGLLAACLRLSLSSLKDRQKYQSMNDEYMQIIKENNACLRGSNKLSYNLLRMHLYKPFNYFYHVFRQV